MPRTRTGPPGGTNPLAVAEQSHSRAGNEATFARPLAWKGRGLGGCGFPQSEMQIVAQRWLPANGPHGSGNNDDGRPRIEPLLASEQSQWRGRIEATFDVGTKPF